MVKHRIFITALCGTILLSSLGISGFSASAVDTENALVEEPTAAIKVESFGPVSTVDPNTVNDKEELVIEGEVGDVFVSGDLIFKIVANEEVDRIMSPTTRASKQVWSIPLEGDQFSKAISLNSSYPYAKVWIKNEGSSGIKFTITKNTPTGSVISGSAVTIASNTSTSVYSTNAWSAGVYLANYTSGKADMKGKTACRLASTEHELDV